MIRTGRSLLYDSNSPKETFELGQRIACKLEKGSVVALQGGLGSGKTCLSKGIAAGLGITETITSPTYTIISEYQNMNHIDAYRLENEEDFEGIGGSEIINGDKISVIEWSDRIQRILPPNTINIKIEITGASSRLIKIGGLCNL